MRRKTGIVHGVGINDSDYLVYATEYVGGRQKNIWICPFYKTWRQMITRCYSDKFQIAHPTYFGCTVSEGWHSFMAFREWMITQEWEGNELDKDILVQGNKVYSQEVCVFVSKQLNGFITDCAASRGALPVGVDFVKSVGRYRARCNNPFIRKIEHLGYFSDQSDAHEAWRARKHEIAYIYADKQKDNRIAAALRIRYATSRA